MWARQLMVIPHGLHVHARPKAPIAQSRARTSPRKTSGSGLVRILPYSSSGVISLVN